MGKRKLEKAIISWKITSTFTIIDDFILFSVSIYRIKKKIRRISPFVLLITALSFYMVDGKGDKPPTCVIITAFV